MRVFEWFRNPDERDEIKKQIENLDTSSLPNEVSEEKKDLEARRIITGESDFGNDETTLEYEKYLEKTGDEMEFMSVLTNHVSDLLKKIDDVENIGNKDHNIDLTADYMTLVSKDIAVLSSLLSGEHKVQNRERPTLKETFEKIEDSRSLINDILEISKKKETELTEEDINKFYNFEHALEEAMFSLQSIRHPSNPELN